MEQGSHPFTASSVKGQNPRVLLQEPGKHRLQMSDHQPMPWVGFDPKAFPVLMADHVSNPAVSMRMETTNLQSQVLMLSKRLLQKTPLLMERTSLATPSFVNHCEGKQTAAGNF